MALPTTCLGWFFHVLLFPLKFLLYHTVPDVRKPGNENRYWTNIAMSVFWLAVSRALPNPTSHIHPLTSSFAPHASW